MAKITIDLIRKIREETGAGVMDVKKVLDKVEGDEGKATKILREKGFEKAAKKEERETKQGLVVSYLHHSGKIGSLLEIFCETDFVARNELFQALAKEVAMQIASMNPKSKDELLKQEYIRDATKKIGDLVKETVAKTGENIRIGKFYRIQLGEEK